MLILLWLLVLQESYYVDGTELILTDGTRILTLSEVKTDLYSYYWYEDGVYITLLKSNIKKVDYFSFRELGRRPKARSKNIHQRRIGGNSVLYHREGESFLKVLHVDHRGKSIEGRLSVNKVVFLKFESDHEENLFQFNLQFSKPNYLMEFHFYDMKGKRVATSMVDLEMFAVSRKQRKKGLLNGFFRLPGKFDPNQIGLVEVVSTPKKDHADE